MKPVLGLKAIHQLAMSVNILSISDIKEIAHAFLNGHKP